MIALLFLSSCFVVKHEGSEDIAPELSLSTKPEITMSDVIIRSNKGDFISFIPENWFLVDLEDRISSDIIAVAVNPEYSLSAVFSQIRANDQINRIVKKEELLGLARMSLAKREKKTAGAIKQSGKYIPIKIGRQKFVRYDYLSNANPLPSSSIVFISSTGNFYEFSLLPMDVKGYQNIDKKEYEKILRSIISTIKF